MIKTILNEHPIDTETDSLICRRITLHGMDYNKKVFTYDLPLVKFKQQNEYFVTIHNDGNMLIYGGTKDFDMLTEIVTMITIANSYTGRVIDFQIKTTELVGSMYSVEFNYNKFTLFLNIQCQLDGILVFFNDYVISVTGKDIDVTRAIMFLATGRYLYETSK